MGRKIPGWESMRVIIGKGSATDINRGIREYLEEQGQTLRSLGGDVPGVPEAIHPIISEFWQAALKEAQKSFSDQVNAYEIDIANLNLSLESAQHSLSEMAHRAEVAEVTAASKNDIIQALEAQIKAEHQLRLRDERMGLRLRHKSKVPRKSSANRIILSRRKKLGQ